MVRVGVIVGVGVKCSVLEFGLGCRFMVMGNVRGQVRDKVFVRIPVMVWVMLGNS